MNIFLFCGDYGVPAEIPKACLQYTEVYLTYRAEIGFAFLAGFLVAFFVFAVGYWKGKNGRY